MNTENISHSILGRNSVAIVFVLAAVALSCQSPLETPPVAERTVLVHVQNARGEGMEQIPVEMREFNLEDERKVLHALTNRNGDAVFFVVIPTTGKAFNIIAGDDVSGRVSVDANLLCRDTVIVIELSFEELPCGGEITRTLRFDNICAPLLTGELFSDSAEARFVSACNVPLTFTLSEAPQTDVVQLRLIDANGNIMSGTPFILPARGHFSVRAVATPTDSGVFRSTFVFTGSGPNQTSVVMRLTVEVLAVNCNTCDCPDTLVVVDFGMVQALPSQVRSTRNIQLPRNLCNFDRIDRLIKGASLPTIFGVSPVNDVLIGPGASMPITLSFIPAEIRDYEDTVLIEHHIPAEQKRCTTMIVLRGHGCGPECSLVENNLTQSSHDRYELRLHRARVYQDSRGEICFDNVGRCGLVTLSLNAPSVPGFSVSPDRLDIPPEERRCFSVHFHASDAVVWPEGHGRPAKVTHEFPVVIHGCDGQKNIDIRVSIDTLPAQFSRCIYQWDQNENYGYNFTPIEGKGEDKYDPDVFIQQLSDIAVRNVLPGVSADVLIQRGWKFIKADVTEAQFNFDDMYNGTNGWTRAEYDAITREPFSVSQDAAFAYRSVYSIRIERNGMVFIACVRVREVSMDPDGKYKMCLDVLFPMIKE